MRSSSRKLSETSEQPAYLDNPLPEEKKLISLFESDKKDKEIIHLIRTTQASHPHFLANHYNGGKTVFHLLDDSQRFDCLSSLLFEFISFARAVDAKNRTILHYHACHKECHQPVVQALLSYLPDIINDRDCDGNTALHLALSSQNIVLSDYLLKIDQIDLNLANNAGSDPITLADKIMLKLSAYSQQRLKLAPENQLTEKKQDYLKKQHVKFNLPEGTQLCWSGCSDMAFLSSSGVADEELLSFDYREFDWPVAQDYLIFRMDNTADDGSVDAIILFINAASKLINGPRKIDKQIKYNFKTVDYTQDKQTDIFLQRSCAQSYALQYLLSAMHEEVKKDQPTSRARLDDSIQAMYRLFLPDDDKSTLKTHHKTKSKDRQRKKTIRRQAKQHRVGFIIDGMIQTASLQQCRCIIDGISQVEDPGNIMNDLFNRLPDANRNQMIAINLLMASILTDGVQVDGWEEYLQKLYETNEKWLHCHSKELVPACHHLMKAVTCFLTKQNESILHKNYVHFRDILYKSWVDNNKDSFDALLHHAMSQTEAERADAIELLASELITVSKRFYQLIEARDMFRSFDTESKLNDYRQFYQRFTNYLLDFILSQPKKNVSKAMEVLLHLAATIKSVTQRETYIDLNSLGLILSLFEHADIVRLEQFKQRMSDASKKTLSELTQLCHYDDYVQISRKRCQNSLPMIEVLHKQLTSLSGDKGDQKSYLMQLEHDGALYQRLKAIKSELAACLLVTKTNVVPLIENHEMKAPFLIKSKSLKLIPNTQDSVPLKAADWCEFLSTLEALHAQLQQNTFPCFILDDKEYMPSKDATKKLHAWLKGQAKNNFQQPLLAYQCSRLSGLLVTVAQQYDWHIEENIVVDKPVTMLSDIATINLDNLQLTDIKPYDSPKHENPTLFPPLHSVTLLAQLVNLCLTENVIPKFIYHKYHQGPKVLLTWLTHFMDQNKIVLEKDCPAVDEVITCIKNICASAEKGHSEHRLFKSERTHMSKTNPEFELKAKLDKLQQNRLLARRKVSEHTIIKDDCSGTKKKRSGSITRRLKRNSLALFSASGTENEKAKSLTFSALPS